MKSCNIAPLIALQLLYLLSICKHEIAQAKINSTIATNSSSINKFNATNDTSDNLQKSSQIQLTCQPGEQRYFQYESTTQVWAGSHQLIKLRAKLRLRCLEPASGIGNSIGNKTITSIKSNATASGNLLLRYLAEVTNLEARAVDKNGDEIQRETGSEFAKRRKFAANGEFSPGDLQAEPLLEEVGETVLKMQRSVSGWLDKAWSSVKTFFTNIFTTSERSTINRDQAMTESGIDIGSQCRASGKRKLSGGLPIDDSMFDDLEPSLHYIPTSSFDDQTLGLLVPKSSASLDSTTKYDLIGDKSDNANDNENDENLLSFFDDPKAELLFRSKRATDNDDKSQFPSKSTNIDFESFVKIPFVFVQSQRGKIMEIRFAANDSDSSVRNFKRHLCDLFATNLSPQSTSMNNNSTTNKNKAQVNGTKKLEIIQESSPIGDHSTNYLLDLSANGTAIKRALGQDSKLIGQFDKLVADSSSLLQTAASTSTSTSTPTLSSGSDIQNSNEFARELPPELSNEPLFSMSILRTINTTNSLLAATTQTINANGKNNQNVDDEMLFGVQLVQQISDGRLMGSAGTLSMSIVSPSSSKIDSEEQRKRRRRRRQSSMMLESNELADLIQVTTSFSVKLVAPNSGSMSTSSNGKRKRRALASNGLKYAKFPIEKAPSDANELRKTLNELRMQESRLKLAKTSLKNEISSSHESQLGERLELLRDQVQMRLNEEYLGNKMRRISKSAALLQSRQSFDNDHNNDEKIAKMQLISDKIKSTNGDLGLSLTQLILDSGSTKHKGSLYPTLEEIIELESSLDTSKARDSMSQLLRETLKVDKLRSHCKSAIISVEQIRLRRDQQQQQNRVAFKQPFGDEPQMQGPTNRDLSKIIGSIAGENGKRLEQCSSILRLLLRVNERAMGDLVIDLIDECNQRLLVASKHEELGYGPMSRYYRQLRQQFIELMSQIKRPTEAQLDRLTNRLSLYYHEFATSSKQATAAATTNKPHSNSRASSDSIDEFVYVNIGSQTNSKDKTSTNKVLREEDDSNNRDQAGSLLMTITTLASKPSISNTRRKKIIETLLMPLKSTTCSSHLSSPDLDILESMGNFRQQKTTTTTTTSDVQSSNDAYDELVSGVFQLSRKCRSIETYQLASIHALQGQLQHKLTQRLFAELLRPSNTSCAVKSEIVLSLISAIELVELENSSLTSLDTLIENQPTQSANSIVNENSNLLSWPISGFNALDDLLLEMVEVRPVKREHLARFELDRRCLRKLIAHYMTRKKNLNNNVISQQQAKIPNNRYGPANRGRSTRSVRNEDQFWDEANCKRWTTALNEPLTPYDTIDAFTSTINGNDTATATSLNREDNDNDNLDLEENSILGAIVSSRLQLSSKPSKTLRSLQPSMRSALLINATSINNDTSNTNNNINNIRRRLKCTASKQVGPKSAQAMLKAEIVNDLVNNGQDENKFLARFSLGTSLLGRQIDVGRMYLWHQRRVTRAHVKILGKNLWDSSHSCLDKAPQHLVYMPLFDMSLWLVKISIGMRLQSEMGFFSDCSKYHYDLTPGSISKQQSSKLLQTNNPTSNDELRVYPTITLQASGEASARLVVARAGLSLASRYGYQGDIRVSKQPDSCMSIESAHQPMNVTLSSWLQLWDSDCHFWGSRNRAQPQATRWKLNARKPTVWLDDECLQTSSYPTATNETSSSTTTTTTTTSASIPPIKPGSSSSLDAKSTISP